MTAVATLRPPRLLAATSQLPNLAGQSDEQNSPCILRHGGSGGTASVFERLGQQPCPPAGLASLIKHLAVSLHIGSRGCA